jgi:hypothetical protein
MSQKPGFSNGLPLECPGVQGKRPHRGETLGGAGIPEIVFRALLAEAKDSDAEIPLGHRKV